MKIIHLSSHFIYCIPLCSVGDGSPSSPRNSMAVTPIVITNDRKGYGMTLKPIRVYIGDSNNYRIHHIVQVKLFYKSFANYCYIIMSLVVCR